MKVPPVRPMGAVGDLADSTFFNSSLLVYFSVRYPGTQCFSLYAGKFYPGAGQQREQRRGGMTFFFPGATHRRRGRLLRGGLWSGFPATSPPRTWTPRGRRRRNAPLAPNRPPSARLRCSPFRGVFSANGVRRGRGGGRRRRAGPGSGGNNAAPNGSACGNECSPARSGATRSPGRCSRPRGAFSRI